MVFGGSAVSTAEIIDMKNETTYCSEPNSMEYNKFHSFGGLLTNASAELATPLICGGDYEAYNTTNTATTCYTFDGKNFNYHSDHLSEPRSNAASVVFEGSILWVSGGYNISSDGHKTSKLSSEIYYQQWGRVDSGNDLPNSTYAHCAVKLNESHALILGGHETPSMSIVIKYDDYSYSGRWSEGPEFNGGDANYFTCTTFTQNGDQKVMIYSSELNSLNLNHKVQVLDLKDWHWEEAPTLPAHSQWELQLVTFQNVPYVVGFEGKHILKYVCKEGNIETCEWQQISQTFKYNRTYFTAMLIPDEMAFCE